MMYFCCSHQVPCMLEFWKCVCLVRDTPQQQLTAALSNMFPMILQVHVDTSYFPRFDAHGWIVCMAKITKCNGRMHDFSPHLCRSLYICDKHGNIKNSG